MTPGSYTNQRNSCVHSLVNLTEQNELTGAQGLAERSDAGSNKVFIPLEASTPPFILFPAKDLFTKFMKMFIKMTQVQAEPQKRPLKARTLKTNWGKSYMKCYHFCQQCEDYFEILGATGMNCTLFAALFFHSPISIKWAQHNRHHTRATSIM